MDNRTGLPHIGGMKHAKIIGIRGRGDAEEEQ
jgi:hypothetical protein